MKLDLSKSFDVNKANSYFEKLIEKKARIELKEFRAKRSLSQNAYLHVCFGFIAKNSGYTIEESKVITKREFGSFMIYEKEKFKFLRSTADLDKLEMTSFIEFLRMFANDNLGVYIPTPEEFIENEFDILKQLQNVQ